MVFLIIAFIADGRSIHTQRWAEFFARSGHEVHLLTYDPMDRIIPGVTEHVIASRFKNLYLSFWPRQLAINRIISRIRPDLVHAHFITKYGFHLPFLGQYPKIVTAWGDDVLVLPQSSRLLFHFTKAVLDSADIVYAVSHDIRSHIIRDFTIPENKVRYLPFGVDTVQFSPLEGTLKTEKNTVNLFSNRGFLPIYGMDALLEGFHIAFHENPGLRLVLKGDGPDKEKIRREVKKRGLEPYVVIRDMTEYGEVSRELRETDIFITVSGRDGTPVSLLEAMSTGLACIATAVGGIPEWIRDGENGILVPPRSPKIIADKILYLSADRELRDRLGKCARKTILEKGDWSSLMQNAQNDYSALVRQNPSRHKTTDNPNGS